MALSFLRLIMSLESSILFFLLCCELNSASRIQGSLKFGPKPRISIALGTPPQKQLLDLDLDAPLSYLPCKTFPGFFQIFNSSSYTSIPCSSKLCSKLKPPGNSSSPSFCQGQLQCLLPVTDKDSASLFRDVITGFSNSGATPRALFGCSSPGPLNLVSLSRSRRALPFAISSTNNLPRKFTICLSPDVNSSSPIFFGDDSSYILGGINVSSYVSFTPLIINPFFRSSYYLALKGIRIDSSEIPLPPSLFSVDPKTGLGGLKLSTKEDFTKLPTPAYDAIAGAFTRYAKQFNISVVAPVSPGLNLCFNASEFSYGRLGPVTPVIEFEFVHGESWSFGGASSIRIKDGVGCLAFIDAGKPPVTSAIGSFQMFDNLLHFDVAASRFGFVDGSLHILRQNCLSNFS